MSSRKTKHLIGCYGPRFAIGDMVRVGGGSDQWKVIEISRWRPGGGWQRWYRVERDEHRRWVNESKLRDVARCDVS